MNGRRRHFVIPDTQVKPGVPIDHMRWVGRAIREYEPEVVVHLGDHWDFPSLSRWSADGSLEREGQRVSADIAAGNVALRMLEDAMAPFKPRRKVLLRGNHEDRLTRYVRDRPLLDGALGFHLLNDRKLGWEVVDYFHGSPQAIEIDGIQYAHYFANPNTGKPIGGTITNRLAKIGSSFVQGHVQGLLQGNVQYATGIIRHGIVAGSAYLHDEEFKGMANAHWRGVVVLNEVHKGQFCEMPLTLDYLCRKYEGMSVARYLQRNRRGAKARYILARNIA
ncbi:MAG: metallophosphoesterase [Bradyrhizobium sp.]|nr:metallophosphoesterase [Bradyrhizobium sp.]